MGESSWDVGPSWKHTMKWRWFYWARLLRCRLRGHDFGEEDSPRTFCGYCDKEGTNGK